MIAIPQSPGLIAANDGPARIKPKAAPGNTNNSRAGSNPAGLIMRPSWSRIFSSKVVKRRRQQFGSSGPVLTALRRPGPAWSADH
jgi:hypothetical protein